MNKRIKIAMGQMLVRAGELEANLSRAVRFVFEAAERGCHLIVLPETLDLGWTYPDAMEGAHPIPGPSSDQLSRAAKEAGIYVVAGLTERCGDKLYNAAVVISSTGEILLTHRKINELSFALDLYHIGDGLHVTETEFGIIGAPICADLRPNGNPIGNTLGLMGARLLLSPCAWAVEPDHDQESDPYGQGWIDPYTELARTYRMTVVGVSNVGKVEGGEWDGWNCIGCSLAIGPDGNILARGSYGEGAEELLVFELDSALQPSY